MIFFFRTVSHSYFNVHHGSEASTGFTVANDASLSIFFLNHRLGFFYYRTN